jgi:hypothetical protein
VRAIFQAVAFEVTLVVAAGRSSTTVSSTTM